MSMAKWTHQIHQMSRVRTADPITRTLSKASPTSDVISEGVALLAGFKTSDASASTGKSLLVSFKNIFISDVPFCYSNRFWVSF